MNRPDTVPFLWLAIGAVVCVAVLALVAWHPWA